jgi:hypothetical protein
MPVTGSFSRSAVNHASGVRTPMGGLYTGKILKLNEIFKIFINYLINIKYLLTYKLRCTYYFGVEFTDTIFLLYTQSSPSSSHH